MIIIIIIVIIIGYYCYCYFHGASDMVGGARGLVAGRAVFLGALATWFQGQQPQPPGSWAPNLHMQCKHYWVVTVLFIGIIL